MTKPQTTISLISAFLILSVLVITQSDAEPRFPRQLRFPLSRQSSQRQSQPLFFRPRQADESDEDIQDEGGFSRAAQRRPAVFRARPIQEEDESQSFFAPAAPARAPVRAFQQQPSVAARPVVPSSTPAASASRHQQASNVNAFGKGRGGVNALQEEEEKEEESKPDRLTELLTGSKFGCNGKKLGYYADEGLGCEVFHYCADGVRHSWLCPEGQSFHQIHLICMPEGGDNICSQSQKYHFVNDYLYKPINEGTNINETLKYHDRFFPDEQVGEQVQVQQVPRQQHHQQQQQQPQFVQRQQAFHQPQQGFHGGQQFHSASQGRPQPAQFDGSAVSGRLPQFVSPAGGQRQLSASGNHRGTAQRAQTFHTGGQREDPRAFLDYEES